MSPAESARRLPWRWRLAGRGRGIRAERLRPHQSVHELSCAPALRQLERTRRFTTGGERGQHARHARALLAQVGGRHLVLAADDLKGEQSELAIGQGRAPPVELVPRRRGFALGRPEVTTPGIGIGQAQPRIVAGEVLGAVERPEQALERPLRRRQLAAGERQPSLVVGQRPAPLRSIELREERARVGQRTVGRGPIPLADRDRGERLIRPELVQRLPGSLIERQRLERLPTGRGEVALGDGDQRQELARAHRARLVALRLEHGDGPMQVLRGRGGVVELHGDDPETGVRAGDRPEVVRELAFGERGAKGFHRLAQIAPLAQGVASVHQRDGKPAVLPRLPEPLLGLAERDERRVLLPSPVQHFREAPKRLCLDPRVARSPGELDGGRRLRRGARVGQKASDQGAPPPALRLQIERGGGDEGARRVEGRHHHRHPLDGAAGERAPDQRLRLGRRVARGARHQSRARELFGRGVALAALLERPGAAETGVGRIGVGMQGVGVEQLGVEPFGGGIVVAEAREGGEPEPPGPIGGILLEARGPARLDGGDAIALDGLQCPAHDEPGRIGGVDASRDENRKGEGEERCNHGHAPSETGRPSYDGAWARGNGSADARSRKSPAWRPGTRATLAGPLRGGIPRRVPTTGSQPPTRLDRKTLRLLAQLGHGLSDIGPSEVDRVVPEHEEGAAVGLGKQGAAPGFQLRGSHRKLVLVEALHAVSPPPDSAFRPMTSDNPRSFASRLLVAMKSSMEPKRAWYWAQAASRYWY